GRELWNTNIGSGGGSFTSIVYNDLLIFAKPDGYIYALNMMNGTVAWDTKVDTQDLLSINNVISNPLYGNSFQPSHFQTDAQNQRLFWYFAVKNTLPPNNYTGVMCCLNLSDGDMIWIKNLKTGLSGYKWSHPMILNEEADQIFLTGNNSLWIFNATTGDLVYSQEQFEHYILTPLVSENITFVASDLWLFAYSRPSSP
ncbi:MAG: PQQ-binding-like beta-propeller repeat protein, partial [Candidatus Bathyarchaeota archaeon]